MQNLWWLKMKEYIEKFLNNSKIEKSLIILICLNIVAFVLQSDVNINAKFEHQFYLFEVFSISIFTLEYFLRIFSMKKLTEIFSFYMLIDLIAILPFYLSFCTVNMTFIRILRLFRLARIFKITRYIDAFENIKNAFLKRKDELIVTSIIFLFAILISSISIYFAEAHTGAFESVISSFWWSVITCTTVGYGDAYPVTSLGKIIASMTAIFGVGLHGILIGLISSALIDIIKGKQEV